MYVCMYDLLLGKKTKKQVRLKKARWNKKPEL